MTTLPLSLTIINDPDRLENFLMLMGLDVILGGFRFANLDGTHVRLTWQLQTLFLTDGFCFCRVVISALDR